MTGPVPVLPALDPTRLAFGLDGFTWSEAGGFVAGGARAEEPAAEAAPSFLTAPPSPTTVQLADGTTYTIPSGAPGTWPWVRQASLVAKAYRQVGDEGTARSWDLEFTRRQAIFDAAARGDDLRMVLAQFGRDLLMAPVRILADVGDTALKVGERAGEVVSEAAGAGLGIARALPVLVLAVLVVLGIGLYRRSLGVRVG